MSELNRKNFLALAFVALLMAIGIWRAISQNSYKQLDVTEQKYGGVMVRIVVQYPEKDADKAQAAVKKCFAAIDRMEALMSYFKKTSDVSRYNAAQDGQTVEMDPLTLKIIRQSQELCDKTLGAFDITFTPVEKMWKKAMKDEMMPSEEDIKQAVAKVGSFKLMQTPNNRGMIKIAGTEISLNGIAEGCGVDMAVEVLREAGIQHAMVDSGGELGFIGNNVIENKPWTVEIKHPRMKGAVSAGELAIENKCVTTTGDYEKNYHVGTKKIHHVYDPRTGRPVEHLPSVTVIAPNCTIADGLSTALAVLGVERSLKILKESYPGVSAIFIEETADGKLVPHCTPDLEGKINFTLSTNTATEGISESISVDNNVVKSKTINMKMLFISKTNFKNAEITHSFYISETEITQAQYKIITDNNPSFYQDGKNGAPPDTSNYPVEKVSYRKAVEFCKKLTDLEHKNLTLPLEEEYRLPNFTEWTFACSDNPDSKWFFGDDINLLKDYAWYKDNSNDHIHEVARLHPNKFGLYDMHGNVMEWTLRTTNTNSLEPYTWCYGGGYDSEPDYTITQTPVSNYGGAQNDIGFRIIRIKTVADN